MGSYHSINQTPLGKSLIGKKFATKDHVCFFYCGNSKTYSVREWKDEQDLGLAGANSINLEIQSNIKFEIIDVIDVISVFDIDGRNLKIMIKILNNIQIKDIGKILEYNKLEDPTPILLETIPKNWIYRDNLGEICSTMLPLFDQHNLNIVDI